MKTINPYLTFDGNCEEAFNFYKSAFNEEFAAISRFKDMPKDGGMSVDDADLKKILHVALPIGEHGMLMGSDTPSGSGVDKGNNISVSVHMDSEEEADRIFKKLSNGGTVTMPLGKTFWNAYFGMCIDRFGIHWMVNYDYQRISN